jgi:hypothetical protein
MILTVNSDYFLKQRQPVDLCNGEVLCFLCGTDYIYIYIYTGVPKRCIHIIIRTINLVYTSLWGTCMYIFL